MQPDLLHGRQPGEVPDRPARREGLSTEEIIDEYVFLTAGACGPCRFGMYVTEYRKALRDAGFDGFRVMLFQQQGGLAPGHRRRRRASSSTRRSSSRMHQGAARRRHARTALGYRHPALRGRARRHEPRAWTRRRRSVYDALLNEQTNDLLRALTKAKKVLREGRGRPARSVKPKVAIIGEFWAMTTEGDGNYAAADASSRARAPRATSSS